MPDEMPAAAAAPDGFDERSYLIAFPDIGEAIAAGQWKSGLQHYLIHGTGEDRLNDLRYRNAVRAADTASFPAGCIDDAFVSPGGRLLVIGWLDDEAAPLGEVACLKTGLIIATIRHVARCCREDVEPVFMARRGRLLGFWTMLQAGDGFAPSDEIQLSFSTGCEQKTFPARISYRDDESLRERALEYLAVVRYFADPQAEAPLQLNGGLGDVLIQYSMELTRRIVAGAHVQRFGPQRSRLDGSIIVCLFGKADYLFLQAAQFSGCAGADRYEFVYISNSPELAERLMKEAASASPIYRVAITLVILPGNAGFGAANNVAAEHTRSDHLLIVNPDVFPRDQDWATRHSQAVAGLPAEQTVIFGIRRIMTTAR